MTEVINSIRNNFRIISEEKLKDDKLSILIDKEDIYKVAKFLKEELNFDFLHCISGVDYKKEENNTFRFQIVYHFYSTKNNEWLVVKVNLKEGATLKSITSIFKTADWQEREIYDLLGIEFIDHPNLKRILLPDEWIGHPLRKDYKKETPDLKLR